VCTTRRNFVCIVSFTYLAHLRGKAVAETAECEGFPYFNFNTRREPDCVVGQVFDFPYRPAAQSNTMWCWAACLEALLLFANVDFVSQDDIIHRLFGAKANTPANMELIARAINGTWRDDANPEFAIDFEVRQFFPSGRISLVDGLLKAARFFAEEKTLICIGLVSQDGRSGHLVLSKEFRLSRDLTPDRVTGVLVFDPLLPVTTSGFRHLTAAEMSGIRLLFSVDIKVL
jgi:hypothetical protein